GQLGAATVRAWSDAGHVVAGLTRSRLDITNPGAVRSVIGGIRPDLIINCAADNRVDAAQSAPLPPLSVNAWAVRTLAHTAADLGATFVHYSTDFVFDGVTDRPYTEGDPPNPGSVYGMTKLLGEMLATDAPRHYVLRVESLFGGATGGSSIDRLWSLMEAGRPATAFSDRMVSPSLVEDVTAATRAMVELHPAAGLYHCVNTGYASWFDVIDELRQLGGFPPSVLSAGRAADASFPAPRPMFAALSNRKLQEAGVTMPSWQDAVARYASRRRQR
ncbi:MAG TPA: NAD(P)-dependent oxidoreductase, partial [Vicinamibacterales bacterium]|nr:NAD(P)-dependent oxidoreductase [Vicinamibacterales bacterium]